MLITNIFYIANCLSCIIFSLSVLLRFYKKYAPTYGELLHLAIPFLFNV